ncbi:MAG: bifunctional adenosylcobinamide kinase/adenosylcobinamide-phosphate guanylyltransferase [Clostridiales bacterium]|nr:bifunctional adenosylcobinamide kinase/adenosylcobinamide-phosphate guanylyltransferase [Clostridiales bacterium]
MKEQNKDSTFHLVTGGSGSGKSAYAEDCVSRLLANRYGEEKVCPDLNRGAEKKANAHCVTSLRCVYIATMIPYGEDGKRRVERHRRLRREKHFETIECYTGLEHLILENELLEMSRRYETDANAVLREIRSDANGALCGGMPENQTDVDYVVLLECMSNLVANEVFEPDGAGKGTVEAIQRGIDSLRRQARHLIVVTNEVFSDGVSYDTETMRYLSYLGAVNQAMAAQADMVTEVVYGIPVTVKK